MLISAIFGTFFASGSYVKIGQELASELIFHLGEIFLHILELSLSNIS